MIQEWDPFMAMHLIKIKFNKKLIKMLLQSRDQAKTLQWRSKHHQQDVPMHSSTEKSKTTQETNENIKNNTNSVADEINPSTPLPTPARPNDIQDLHAFFSFISMLIYLLSSSWNPIPMIFLLCPHARSLCWIILHMVIKMPIRWCCSFHASICVKVLF